MASTAKYTENAPRVMLKNVRLSFPHLAVAQAPKVKPGEAPGVPKFNAAFIADDKSTVKITSNDGSKVIFEGEVTPGMTKLLDHLINDLWKKRPPKMKPVTCAGVVSEDTGMGYSKEGVRIDGYEDGNYTVNAKNKKRPKLLDRAKNDLVTQEEIETTLYAGCRVDASVELYAADDDSGQAIYSVLRGVKFVRDDEPLSGGGRIADANEFDDSEDESDFG